MNGYLRACLSLLMLSLLGLGAVSCSPQVERPNVIWIVLDACRASNLSCYGHDRITSPNIDALAQEGVLFENNFSQAAYTTLSVPSYMTGRYFPVRCFSNGPWERLWATRPPGEQFFARVMAENGYATCMVTAHPWMDKTSTLSGSFQDSFLLTPDPENAHMGYVRLKKLSEKALSWIRTHREQRFFLYLHAMDTHFPHFLEAPYDVWVPEDVPHPELVSRKSVKGGGLLGKKDQQYLQALHDGSILYSDTVLGEFFDALRLEGLMKETLVVLCADHGEALAEDGKTLRHPSGANADELFHVPLVMAGPLLPQGKRVSALTENVDIIPTLVDLLGLDSTAQHDGRSLRNLMFGNESPSLKDYTFAKWLAWGMEDFGVLLRFKDYKLVDERLARGAGNAGPQEFWSVPDHLATRKRISADTIPNRAEAMRTVLETEIQPFWDAYNALPRTTPVPFELPISPQQIRSPRESFTENSRKQHARDGRWFVGNGSLLSCVREDAPPITLELAVPNHSYAVQILVHCQPPEKVGNKEAPVFHYKAQEDSEDKQVFAPHFEGREFLNLGVYQVTDGTFTITLNEGDLERFVIASRFRFIPVSSDGLAEGVGSDRDRLEQLEALGYLD